MNVIHRVTAYDKQSEVLALEFDVPESCLSEVRRLAQAPEEQLTTYGSLALDDRTARSIIQSLHIPANVDLYDWFLEPFAS